VFNLGSVSEGTYGPPIERRNTDAKTGSVHAPTIYIGSNLHWRLRKSRLQGADKGFTRLGRSRNRVNPGVLRLESFLAQRRNRPTINCLAPGVLGGMLKCRRHTKTPVHSHDTLPGVY
jgi:hypothetical protein